MDKHDEERSGTPYQHSDVVEAETPDQDDQETTAADILDGSRSYIGGFGWVSDKSQPMGQRLVGVRVYPTDDV